MNIQKISKNIKKLSNIEKIKLNTVMIDSDIRIATCYIVFFIFVALAMNFFVFGAYLNSIFLILAATFAGAILVILFIVAIILMNAQEKIIINFLTKNKRKRTR